MALEGIARTMVPANHPLPVAGASWPDGPARRLGGRRDFEYRRTTMRVNRQRRATTGLVVLAVLAGSLWAGALAGSRVSGPADQLTASHARLGVEAVPPDRAPALRPSAQRPNPGSPHIPLVLGMVVAALAAMSRPRARRRRSDRARVGALVWSTQREARAPPRLQPA
jgi:hypothetical protein